MDKNARNIKPRDFKILFALSGNQCAFPDCEQLMIAEDKKTIVGIICHIEAVSPNGARFNKSMTVDERRHRDNLILLCGKHHSIIDNRENINDYPVALLKKMKKKHELKMSELMSKNNLIDKYPSVLGEVIMQLGSMSLFDENNDDIQTAPSPEEKITYNNIVDYRFIIEEYRVYQGRLNKIYQEIEKQGSLKKASIQMSIKSIYLKEKAKYRDFKEIQNNADRIIDSVKDQLLERFLDQIKSESYDANENISIEAVNNSILIVVVDAFMNCQILEEPL